MATSDTQLYKLNEGHYSRWEGDKATGKRAKYRAGVEGSDTVELNSEQAKLLAKRITMVPNDQRRPVSTAPVIDLGVQQRGQFTPQGGKEGTPLDPAHRTDVSPATDTGEGEDEGVADLSAADAIEVINSLSDPDAVKAAAKEEKAGKGRVTVLEAADARLKELKKG